jgi:hypothetical protein
MGGTLNGGGTFRVSYFYSQATPANDPENILIGSVIAGMDRKSGLPFVDQQQNAVTLVPPGRAQLDATVEPTAPKIMVSGCLRPYFLNLEEERLAFVGPKILTRC